MPHDRDVKKVTVGGARLVRAARAAAGWSIAAGLAALCGSSTAFTQQTPTIRSRIDLARVDVTVVDTRTGTPINDLAQSDFAITEDGVPQTITAFARQSIAAAAPAGPAADVTAPAAPSESLAPKNRRVFLIVLGQGGRGGLARSPVRAYEGVLEFLRKRTLPQDLVSIVAFNRATDLTTDRDYLIRVVERVRAARDAIWLDLFTTNPIMFGPQNDVTEPVQQRIDQVFRAPESTEPYPRSVPSMLRATEEVWMPDQRGPRPWNRYVIYSDLLKTYAGIEYLRHVEGEKHIVCVTSTMLPGGFVMSKEANIQLATRASDAGVAVNIIGIDGTYTTQGIPGTQVGTHAFENMSSKAIAERSGGQYTSLRYVGDQLGRIDEASRTGYVLGYTPTNAAMDGRFRAVKVTVARRNVTVLYRHGYTATDRVAAVDLRQIVTMERLQGAAASTIESRDIKIDARAASVPEKGGPGHVRVDLKIDPARLALREADGRRVGRVDLLILCGDDRRAVVCTDEQALVLNMDEARYLIARESGLTYSTNIPLTGRPSYVRVVLYDYDADLLGTALVKLR